MTENRRSGRLPRVLGLLDIGSYKIACLILADTGAPAGNGPFLAYRVAGTGHQRSRGLKAGVITNLDEAEESIRSAIAQAERMAGVTLEEVLISVACGRLNSQIFAAHGDVENRVVSEEDIARVMGGARAFAERKGRAIVHLNRVGFRLDGVPGVLDPAGMAGGRLTADIHAVTADEAPLRNLLNVVERCYLNVAGIVPSALASAAAVTTPAERNLGVTCIDIGGGTTTVAAFAEGRFIYTQALPVGGGLLTFDIARTLQTPLAEAERIKALYGTLVGAQSDEHELISYPMAGMEDAEAAGTTKAALSSLIRPRFESLLGMVRDRLEKSGVAAYAGEHVVLTGGGSQLAGAAEFSAKVLQRPVRVSRPEGLSGLPPAMSGPAFATLIGLLSAGQISQSEAVAYGERDHLVQGYLGRVGDWLKQGF